MKLDAVKEQYQIERELGRGRFARVCLAHHKASGRNFAAKFIRRRGSGCDLTSSIEREISILRSAERVPSIVGIHEDYMGPREATLIIEHCSGGDLYHHIIRNTPLTEQESIIILQQLLDAVQFLHDQQVVHLDIKPENILLKQPYPSLNVALCDFGFARYLDKQSTLRELIGTPDYVAPEILNYEAITLYADMWSIGCVSYFFMAAVSPFWAPSKELTMLRVSKVDLHFPDDSPISRQSGQSREFMECLLIAQPNFRLTVKEAKEHGWLNATSVPECNTSLLEGLPPSTIVEDEPSEEPPTSEISDSVDPLLDSFHTSLTFTAVEEVEVVHNSSNLSQYCFGKYSNSLLGTPV